MNSLTGHIYQLQGRDSLTGGDWENIGDPIIGNCSSITLSDPDESPPNSRFYRVHIQI